MKMRQPRGPLFFHLDWNSKSTLWGKVDVLGFSGGIWLLWHKELVTIEVLSSSSQVINALIKRNDNLDWLFSAIYASPNPRNREMGNVE
jgi:hypothetical protein